MNKKYKNLPFSSNSNRLLFGLGGLWIIVFFACQKEPKTPTLFERLSAERTGIHFKNEIIENDTHNILNFTNLYTGSGVGIGDFDNNGLTDIFLGGCLESSRLYLNQGDFRFKDVTNEAGVNTGRWITGVAVVDINADGLEDVYLSVSGMAEGTKRANLLYINQGLTNGIISFKEQAETYGLADTSQCTHANFFDYDKDGDLDVFMIVNPTNYKLYNVNNIRRKRVNGEATSTDKLYQNNGDGTFTDVSRQAGILIEGYSLSLNVSDLNNDDWPDVYVTNDFLTNDILYINNQDGTFTNQAKEKLKHTSFASMGVDVADINNDGHPEIYVLDMFPEDNYRQKMIMGADNYDRFQYMLKMGYEPQYSRNTMQLNNGDGTYSEIGQLLAVHKTDWSWSALLADYDNDGFRDLYVTNGFRRDLGNLDFVNYSNSNAFGSPESRKIEQLKAIKEQPGAKLSNYIFKNEGRLNFTKKSREWGIDEPSYSHGAAYADLDNDGDLDLVVNNVSQETFVYKNKADELTQNHYLKVKLKGSNQNPDALGTKVWVYVGKQILYAEHTPYSGYESSVDKTLHFGLGTIKKLDSIQILFPEGGKILTKNVSVDTTIIFDVKASKKVKDSDNQLFNNISQLEFKENHAKYQLFYQQEEDLQVDFKAQPLLPHQHSLLGPAMAKGDVNNDGLEDFFIGGAAGFLGSFFLQKEDQTFEEVPFSLDEKSEDVNALFFDADGDQDLDLYVVSGGVVFDKNLAVYQDRLYRNDGEGNFVKAGNALPQMWTSTKAIAAGDYDNDGDLDLFVGGRVIPEKYPITPESYLLDNEGGIFKNVTEDKVADLTKIGMVTDAIWSDYDNDEDLDLVIVGEWMPITFIENHNGKFIVENAKQAIKNSAGWWNCISEGDFDNDGDMDYLAGNLGLNSNYKASPTEPVCLYVNDYDKNGTLDPVLCQYVDGVEYPVPSRDKLVSQIPPIKVRFTTYQKYAETDFDGLFKGRELKDMQVFESQTFTSSFIENLGEGNFSIHALPVEMQIAPINKFLVKDINSDGYLDAIAVGNTYDTEVSMGRYDAFTSAILLGKGNNQFDVLKGNETGFLADKAAKNLTSLKIGKTDQEIYLVGNNRDSLQIFELTNN